MDPIISIFGLGKLGCSMAAAIAKRGLHVIGVDVVPGVIEKIRKGIAPVQETDLQATISANKERLQATLDTKEAILNSDISFVIVPTPSDERGAFSLQYAAWAFKEIGLALKQKDRYHNVVLSSTVLPGSTRYGLMPILEKESGKVCGKDFGLCYSPEFISLGSVIRDFLNPDFTLVGEINDQAGSQLESCYAKIMENTPPCKRMRLENAELTKIALNTFVTTKMTYANMIAEICEKLPGGDVDVVTDAIGSDGRIGRKYLKGAFGYGGPCFPRDNVALTFIAKSLGVEAELAETTDRINRSFADRAVRRLSPYLRPGMTVAVLGLAYKPFSHVIEESQGVYLVKKLAKTGVRVVAYDPLAKEIARHELRDLAVVFDSVTNCLEQAELVLVTTPDPVFQALTAADFQKKTSKVIVADFWRILEKQLEEQSNIHYIPMGRGVDDRINRGQLEKLWSE